MSIEMLTGSLAQGLLWGIMAIGVYVTYRILDYPDLTADASLTLGAAVTARLITSGVNPLFSTLIAIIAGMCAGAITGFLHTKLRIPPLLSGIITMVGLYSVNLRIMGRANTPLLKSDTVITQLSGILNCSERISTIIVGLIAITIVIVVLWLFFNTEIGYALRATGNNQNMIRALGVNTNKMKVLGLVLGNSLIAFSGALIAQYNGYADIGLGTGAIIIGLASVIIGEVIFSDKNSHRSLIAVGLGSIFYRFIIAFVLSLGMSPLDMKLISAIVLSIMLALPIFKEKFNKIQGVR